MKILTILQVVFAGVALFFGVSILSEGYILGTGFVAIGLILIPIIGKKIIRNSLLRFVLALVASLVLMYFFVLHLSEQDRQFHKDNPTAPVNEILNGSK